MNDLGSALRDLAGEAPAGAIADPVDVWDRGLRRVRRRRLTGVATLVAVLALGYGAIERPAPVIVMPAGKPHAPAIPMNIYSPNRFLAGVSHEGPPGQLAMIAAKQGDEDHRFGSWFGISATTGAYSRLDLPGLATDSPMRLSPDGTRIAYWVTGPTRKESFGPGDKLDSGGPLPDKPLAGVGVYDTRDGSVVRHMIPSNFGLWSGDDAAVWWLADSRLEFGYMVAWDSNTAVPGGAFTWDVGRGEPVQIRASELEDAKYFAAFDPGLLVRDNRFGRLVVVDSEAQPTGDRLVLASQGATVPDAVTFSGDLVVLTGQNSNGGQSQVFAGVRTTGADPVDLAPVGDIVIPHLLGWQSSQSILVTAEPSERLYGLLVSKTKADGSSLAGIYSVDVRSRTVRRLGGVADEDLNTSTVQVAQSLLAEAMVAGRKPPSLIYALRMPIALGALVIMLTGGCWFLVRRRRRA